jgi:hypothetical protein
MDFMTKNGLITKTRELKSMKAGRPGSWKAMRPKGL